MMMKQMFTVLLIAFLCILQTATAIRCYQCKSLTDPNCAKDKIDANSNIRQVDCDQIPRPNYMEQLQPVTKCNKVVTSDRAGIIVSRDCHFEVVGQKDNVCTVTHSSQVESCFTCKGDLCNASGAAKTYATIGVVVAMIGMFAMQQIL